MKAGHLAGQQEDEFVKQIKNVLSSTSAAKKLSTTESAPSISGATPSTTAKDGSKATPIHEQPAEVKIGAPLDAMKHPLETAPPSSLATNSTSSSAPTISTVTTGATGGGGGGGGLTLSASAGVPITSSSSSRPSSQPPSPPSDSIKISFTDASQSTKVVTSSVAISEHTQDSQSESGISTTISTAAASSAGKPMYSQAVINGAATKANTVAMSTAPVFTQTNVSAGATCSIAPEAGSLLTCPVTVATTTAASSDLASLSSSSITMTEVTQPAKKRKVFEVETVNETTAVTETDSPTPDHSEESIHSSTESLSIEPDSNSQQTHSTSVAATTMTAEISVPKNVYVGSSSVGRASPLESRSDSFISVRQHQRGAGTGGGGVGEITEFGGGVVFSSATPEPAPPPNTNAVAVVYQQPQSGQTVTCHLPPGQNSGDVLHCSVPPSLPPMSVHFPLVADAGMVKNQSISTGHAPSSDWPSGYYHYNTAPQPHYVSRPPLAGDTYLPPPSGYNQQHTYHGTQTHHHQHQHFSRTFPQAEQSQSSQPPQHAKNAHAHHLHHIHVHPTTTADLLEKQQEAATHLAQDVTAEAYRAQPVAPPSRTISMERRSPARALTIHDFPQAELLSQAFMQFMYSMSTIFRDPKYEPLVHSLDQQFGQRVSMSSEVPHSAPPTLPTEETEREHSVARCNTQPALTRHSNRDDSELSSIMKK